MSRGEVLIYRVTCLIWAVVTAVVALYIWLDYPDLRVPLVLIVVGCFLGPKCWRLSRLVEIDMPLGPPAIYVGKSDGQDPFPWLEASDDDVNDVAGSEVVRVRRIASQRTVLDPGLSYAALGVYMALMTMADGVDPDGHQLVGRGLGVDEVAEALAELRDRGLVCRTCGQLRGIA